MYLKHDFICNFKIKTTESKKKTDHALLVMCSLHKAQPSLQISVLNMVKEIPQS